MSPSRRVAAVVRLLVLSAVVPAVLAAQGWIDRPPAAPPQLRFGPVLRVASDARIRITDRIAQVEVTERFRNAGTGVAEGDYLYPLPPDAAFAGFTLFQGEQALQGEMLPAEQAQAIYEEIVRRQRDPALLTLAGHRLVRARIFPVQPGETRTVTLRYTVPLARAGDALRLRYPLGARGLPNAPTLTSLVVELEQPARFGAPWSPTHGLETERSGGRLRLRPAASSTGDVEVILPLASRSVGTTVLAHHPEGDDGTVLLSLAAPRGVAARRLPRAVTYVVDVSGSMSGDKIVQARAALRQAVRALGEEDVFRLVAFASEVKRFRDDWSPVTRETVAAAVQFIDDLEANGGTNIAGALTAALGTPAPAARLPLVVFLTDGQPSVGETNPERLAGLAAAGDGRTRVFTVGLGHDVNTYLLERLALEGRGVSEFVPPSADVEVAMSALLGRLRAPVLVNLRLVSSPVPLRALEPQRLPDLFEGDDLLLLARYTGHGRGTVVLEGERDGRTERLAIPVDLPERSSTHDYLPRLWATRRAGSLSRTLRLEGPSPAVQQELTQLALRYGVLTEFTSYLVQEPPAQTAAGSIGRPMAPAAPPPPSPMAQAGAQAFDAARTAAEMRASRSVTTADAANAKLLATPGTEVRQAAGRTFRRRDGAWVDAALRDSLPTTAVEAFSPAYFELLRVLPELRPLLLGDGDQVIAGARGALRIGTRGTRAWRPGELDATVRAFRGA